MAGPSLLTIHGSNMMKFCGGPMSQHSLVGDRVRDASRGKMTDSVPCGLTKCYVSFFLFPGRLEAIQDSDENFWVAWPHFSRTLQCNQSSEIRFGVVDAGEWIKERREPLLEMTE